MKKTISCIGSGNMGFALMKGICTKTNPADIGFTDTDRQKAETNAAKLGAAVYASNTQAAENTGFIFLAVKPQVLEKVLCEIAPVIAKRTKENNAPLLVSMAAGWSIEKIRSTIDTFCGSSGFNNVPVARIMPNTPVLVSRGMTALAVSDNVPEEKTAGLITMLECTGKVDLVSEPLLEAATGLSGSGPAFAYLFIEALADGGVLAGLPRDKALLYAANTLSGSAAMVLETGKHPGELKDMVCSPGGTTIAAIAAMESKAFRATVIEAVKTSWQRSLELVK